MKFRKIIFIMLFLISIINRENDCEKYRKLKIKDIASIKKTDLPKEFSDKAFEVVDKFIRKTIDINYEIVLYFDYTTGNILNCKIGTKTTVEFQFEENEFNGKHVASIHNHTKDMYTPPSDTNFGIFLREWEEYELIAANDCLWILKGKNTDENLVKELRIESSKLFYSSLKYCLRKYTSLSIAYDKCDELYGKRLSNYINNKNIKDIQLIKRRYSDD